MGEAADSFNAAKGGTDIGSFLKAGRGTGIPKGSDNFLPHLKHTPRPPIPDHYVPAIGEKPAPRRNVFIPPPAPDSGAKPFAPTRFAVQPDQFHLQGSSAPISRPLGEFLAAERRMEAAEAAERAVQEQKELLKLKENPPPPRPEGSSPLSTGASTSAHADGPPKPEPSAHLPDEALAGSRSSSSISAGSGHWADTVQEINTETPKLSVNEKLSILMAKVRKAPSTLQEKMYDLHLWFRSLKSKLLRSLRPDRTPTETDVEKISQNRKLIGAVLANQAEWNQRKFPPGIYSRPKKSFFGKEKTQEETVLSSDTLASYMAKKVVAQHTTKAEQDKAIQETTENLQDYFQKVRQLSANEEPVLKARAEWGAIHRLINAKPALREDEVKMIQTIKDFIGKKEILNDYYSKFRPETTKFVQDILENQKVLFSEADLKKTALFKEDEIASKLPDFTGADEKAEYFDVELYARARAVQFLAYKPPPPEIASPESIVARLPSTLPLEEEIFRYRLAKGFDNFLDSVKDNARVKLRTGFEAQLKDSPSKSMEDMNAHLDSFFSSKAKDDIAWRGKAFSDYYKLDMAPSRAYTLLFEKANNDDVILRNAIERNAASLQKLLKPSDWEKIKNQPTSFQVRSIVQRALRNVGENNQLPEHAKIFTSVEGLMDEKTAQTFQVVRPIVEKNIDSLRLILKQDDWTTVKQSRNLPLVSKILERASQEAKVDPAQAEAISKIYQPLVEETNKLTKAIKVIVNNDKSLQEAMKPNDWNIISNSQDLGTIRATLKRAQQEAADANAPESAQVLLQTFLNQAFPKPGEAVNYDFVDKLYQAGAISAQLRNNLLGAVGKGEALKITGTEEEFEQTLMKTLSGHLRSDLAEKLKHTTDQQKAQALSRSIDKAVRYYADTMDREARLIYLTPEAFLKPYSFNYKDALKVYDATSIEKIANNPIDGAVLGRAFLEAHFTDGFYENNVDKFCSQLRLSLDPQLEARLSDNGITSIFSDWDKRLIALYRNPLKANDSRLKGTDFENLSSKSRESINFIVRKLYEKGAVLDRSFEIATQRQMEVAQIEKEIIEPVVLRYNDAMKPVIEVFPVSLLSGKA